MSVDLWVCVCACVRACGSQCECGYAYALVSVKQLYVCDELHRCSCVLRGSVC